MGLSSCLSATPHESTRTPPEAVTTVFRPTFMKLHWVSTARGVGQSGVSNSTSPVKTGSSRLTFRSISSRTTRAPTTLMSMMFRSSPKIVSATLSSSYFSVIWLAHCSAIGFLRPVPTTSPSAVTSSSSVMALTPCPLISKASPSPLLAIGSYEQASHQRGMTFAETVERRFCMRSRKLGRFPTGASFRSMARRFI